MFKGHDSCLCLEEFRNSQRVPLQTGISKDLSEDALEIIRLQNEAVSLALVPAAGGKIIELRDRRSGRDWMWQNPHMPVRRARRDADFESEQDSGGWDEILLSVRPGTINGGARNPIRIPDHGDLIACEWSVDELAVDSGGVAICEMSAKGRAANYRFVRRISVPAEGSLIRFRYALFNDGEESIPAYWCAHPLLRVESTTAIAMDNGLRMRVDDPATRSQCDADDVQQWPELQFRDGSTRDLSRCFADDGSDTRFASKVFVRSASTGEARIVAGKQSLLFRYDPEELPWLGLWINNRAWSGCGSEPYLNLGVEPAMCPYDCINEAISNDAVHWLAAGQERRWSLAVELLA